MPHSLSCPLVLLVATLAMSPVTGTAAAQVVLGLPGDSAAAAARQAAPAPVRAGMADIRKRVLDVHTLITHRRLAPDVARRFAADIASHIATLRDDPATQALAEILDLIADGAAQIAGPMSGTRQLDGLDKIETALARYPLVFDDPDWKPLR